MAKTQLPTASPPAPGRVASKLGPRRLILIGLVLLLGSMIGIGAALLAYNLGTDPSRQWVAAGVLTLAAALAMMLAIAGGLVAARRWIYRTAGQQRRRQEKTQSTLAATKQNLATTRAELRRAIQKNDQRVTKLSERLDDAIKGLQQSQREARKATSRSLEEIAKQIKQIASSQDAVVQSQDLAVDRTQEMLTTVLEHTIDLSSGPSSPTALLESHLSGITSGIKDVQQHFPATERRIFADVEALATLHRALRIRHPLPLLGGWAIAPDSAATLIELILRTRPTTVLEIGSGTSTVLFAYALEQLGAGHVIAIEHDEAYAQKTVDALAAHGLQNNAQVIYAPLVDHAVNDDTYSWYDLDKVDLPSKIDILFVDGPPQSTGHLARYPALPLLRERLDSESYVLLDDAARPDEAEVADRWKNEYGMTLEYLEHARGTALLRWES